MSLLSTIQQSAGALQVSQVGLQVVGQNIANANTPGYIRQQLQQVSGPAVREGNLIHGSGVRAAGIVQVVDKALHARMLSAKTSVSAGETLDQAYRQLEQLAAELDGNGLNGQLSSFNNAWLELSAQPNDSALRELVLLEGQALAGRIRAQREGVLEQRQHWDGELEDISGRINRLTERIAVANFEIATLEGGGRIDSDATGLRDQRYQDLEELAALVNISLQEQDNGSVSVFVGGDYLVHNGTRRDVYTAYDADREGHEVRIVETDSLLQASGGRLAAAYTVRDQIFQDHITQIDQIASALIRAVNEVHSQGQGRSGYSALASTSTAQPGVPLDEAGLPWTPENGSFEIHLVDSAGEPTAIHRIAVRRIGQTNDSTIDSIVADMDAIDGLSASIDVTGRLEIRSDLPPTEFTFANDTSGLLAAIGLNTFFSGSSGHDIAINPQLQRNADHLAISGGGIGKDTEVLARLVDLVDRPLENLGNASIRQTHEDSLAILAQKIKLQSSATEGMRNVYDTISSQHLSVTGVNIDEESIKMIGYQRVFQASSRVIAAAAEMLEILVSL